MTRVIETGPQQAPTKLIWIDLEMTGLDTISDHIIEIATIVTDDRLNELAEGPVITIGQNREVMDAMDEWNTKHHGESGLTTRVLASGTSMQEAEAQTLEFLRAHVAEKASPMCGNSVCQDRRFLARQMPALEAFFHYRNLDVSSLKILAQNWAPEIANGFRKESEHRALADIRDSIAELAYYRDTLFDQSIFCEQA
ncbi:MAG: oligoribonuclease [Woeseia sp.]